MQKNLTQKLLSRSLILSVLLHLLLLISAILMILRTDEQKKPPQDYNRPIKAYTYTGAISPASLPQPQKMQSNNTAQQIQNERESSPLDNTTQAGAIPSAKHYSETTHTKHTTSTTHYQKSILEMSRETLRQNQLNANMHRSKEEAPILLIGDEHAVADPLIKLIGRALSAHFSYPKMEGHFGVHGRVLVEMVFHPEGYFTDVQIVESSNNENLDAAALYAVNTAPKIVGANQFLARPKSFIVGFLFN